MALEAVVFPQEHLACNTKALCATMHAPSQGFVGIGEFEEKGRVALQEEEGGAMEHDGRAWDAAACSSMACGTVEDWDDKCFTVSAPTLPVPTSASGHAKTMAASAGRLRRRRRREKAVKNKEEVENQRRNHIAVERNRRRQMNEYLAVLRSVMPPSYAQRGDQASIVGGAINFVKELEQLLQSLEAQKRLAGGSEPTPFPGFFTFPQYSTAVTAGRGDNASPGKKSKAGARPGLADIEVTMAESHTNVKVLAPRRPRQLLRMVVGLQCLGLTVLHLNVSTTPDRMVFYSFSLKMEDECLLSSADDVAEAVHQMVAGIAEDRVS